MLADRPNGTSTIKAYANLVCALAGTGTLGLPHATALAGWAGLGLIFLSLFMCVYTGIILITSLYLKTILGAMATLFVVCITVGESIDVMAKHAAAGIVVQHEIITLNLPRAMATISFAYGGNVVYPHVEQSMREPKKWNRAIWLALVTCFIMYIVVAAVGYAAYGADTLSPILSNLTKGPLTTSANLLIMVHVMLATPIMLTSLSMMIEKSLAVRWVQFSDDYQGHSFTFRAILRTLISTSICLVALVVPFFGDVMDLLGALTSSLIVFIMPVLFYYRLGGYQGASLAHKLFAVFTLLTGLVAMVVGTIEAARDLVKDVETHR
ncbi:hypothetical protein BGZ73_001813 [Actinomortierella ambigua]|nr:hypothetical protein BGZ73_001813 [Actinomortierella ambigua]